MSEAQHSPPKKMKKSPSQKEKKSKSTSSQLSQQETHGGDDWSELGGPELLSDLPIQTSIPLCLHHIVDAFIRKVLPWQVHLSSEISYQFSFIIFSYPLPPFLPSFFVHLFSFPDHILFPSVVSLSKSNRILTRSSHSKNEFHL
jgi:hypothetical protein